jgi:hypothetical protein
MRIRAGADDDACDGSRGDDAYLKGTRSSRFVRELNSSHVIAWIDHSRLKTGTMLRVLQPSPFICYFHL